MNINKKEKGFTLIELMIVVAIIGILAAIAIPQFASYRIKAFNTSAKADMRSAQTTYEVFFNDNDRYPNSVAATAGTAGVVTLTDGTNTASLNLSSGVLFGALTKATTFATYGAATKNTPGDTIYTATSSAPTIIEDQDSASAGVALVDGDRPAAP